jgi:hypothetical protein
MESPSANSPNRLQPRERFALAFGLVLVVAFGALITARSAFMMNPKTDFQCYARAGWAVRSGADIYEVFDNNGWHYAYPPAFAVAMVPLGDPYPFLPRDGYLPFAASVAFWYALSVLAIGYAAHAFAKVLAPALVRGSRTWWSARLVPVFFCIGSLGHTLGRGQVNTIVLALVAAGFAATMRNRKFIGGAWLAAAAVVKIIPALLVFFPLMRRDGRGLIGYAAAGVVLMVGVPMAVWGPTGAKDTTIKMVEVVLGPVFSDTADQTRAKELHGTTATDNQSVQSAVHAWIHPNRETRPPKAERIATFAHLGIAGGVLLITALVGHRRRRIDDPSGQLVFLGCLGAAMLMASPVSHMHYYAFLYPLVVGLWLGYRDLAVVRYTILVWAVLTHMPLFPGPVFDRLRECGVGIAATLGLWAVGIGTLIGIFNQTHGGSTDSGSTSALKRFSPFTLQS